MKMQLQERDRNMIIDNGRGLVFELDEASALDIGSCQIDGIEIAPGNAVPDDGDPRILHAVKGFLFTCAPDHRGHPEPIEGMPNRKFPLHGSMAATPATDICERRRDVDRREISARVCVRLAQGGLADIHRVWTVNEKTGVVMLDDTVTNIGDVAFPPMLMYHMNIGARLFSDATMLSGPTFRGGQIGWKFGDKDMYVFCVPAVDQPEGGVAQVLLGPIAGAGGKSLRVRFLSETLPHLQMWRNQEGHCNVLGIEPASHPLEKRTELAAMGLMTALASGESRRYGLSFCFE